MRLLVTGRNELVRLWADALAMLTIRHPNQTSKPVVTLSDFGPHAMLTLEVYDATDTRTGEPHERNPLLISQVRLSYFPGVRLARQWMAAAWAGLLQHEALELVTFEGRIVLNPHDEPYIENPCNRGLRDGLPPVLDADSIRRALAVVMDRAAADALAGGD